MIRNAVVWIYNTLVVFWDSAVVLLTPIISIITAITIGGVLGLLFFVLSIPAMPYVIDLFWADFAEFPQKTKETRN